LADPSLIDALARRFGSQCVVIGVDSQTRHEHGTAHYEVWQNTGDPTRAAKAARATKDWVHEAIERGAGEIVLNCMASDGVRNGYDLTQLREIRALCSVPLVASGGAGHASHFIDVFRECDVSGALAASVFHSGEIRIPELKRVLKAAAIEVRP
jgi:cyclase